MPFSTFPSLKAAAAAAALALTLSACTGAPSGTPTAGTSAASGAANALPSSHVHGLSVDAGTGHVLLATHEGLFNMSTKPATRIGPANDLMGFSPAAQAGVFYASGHPGQDSPLPNPMGLIKSSDGGKTWDQLSRQGESDFHALTMTKSGIVAFDGQLRTSPDGKTWTTRDTGFAPAVLAGNPHTNTVLATTPQGLQRSTDGGHSWKQVPSAPVIQFATFANDQDAVGVEPDGTVHSSADSGTTWAAKGRIDGQVQAIAAAKGPDGSLRIWAATTETLLVSSDGGTTFNPAAAD